MGEEYHAVDSGPALFWVLVAPMLFFIGVTAPFIARRFRDRGAVAPIEGLRADFEALMARAAKGEHEAVEALADKLLAFCRAAPDVQTIYAARALCAETIGDFEACDEWAGRAQATGAKAIDDRVLSARRAFCLAALGRVDEAEKELPPISNEPLVVRAHALVASKRGNKDKVLELLRDPSIDAAVGPKSKALFDALRASSGGPYRASSEPIDPDVEAWVKRVTA